jgi:hypothetical protein
MILAVRPVVLFPHGEVFGHGSGIDFQGSPDRALGKSLPPKCLNLFEHCFVDHSGSCKVSFYLTGVHYGISIYRAYGISVYRDPSISIYHDPRISAYHFHSLGIICLASCLHGLDGICGWSAGVVAHMSGCRGVAGGSRNGSRNALFRIPRSRIRRNSGCARFADTDLPARPRSRRFNRSQRPVVLRVLPGKKRQNVLRAVRGPSREQSMSTRVKQPAAMNRLESNVSHQRSP